METLYTFYDADDKVVRHLKVNHYKWETKLWREQAIEEHFKRHPLGTISSFVVEKDAHDAI